MSKDRIFPWTDPARTKKTKTYKQKHVRFRFRVAHKDVHVNPVYDNKEGVLRCQDIKNMCVLTKNKNWCVCEIRMPPTATKSKIGYF